MGMAIRRVIPHGTHRIPGRAPRSDGPASHTSMTLPPVLTKGRRFDVPVEGGFVQAEVIEVTKLTTEEPIRWKLFARELEKPPQEGSILN